MGKCRQPSFTLQSRFDVRFRTAEGRGVEEGLLGRNGWPEFWVYSLDESGVRLDLHGLPFGSVEDRKQN
jgi:hypothetical protein